MKIVHLTLFGINILFASAGLGKILTGMGDFHTILVFALNSFAALLLYRSIHDVQ